MPKHQDGPPAARTLQEIDQNVPLSKEARAFLPDTETAPAFLGRLLDQDLNVDAIRVLAQLLPLRRAVWWAVLCAWHGVGGKPSVREDKALGASVRWVVEPMEEQRRAAEEVAGAGVIDQAADCCVRAAALAGNASTPDGPLLPVDPLRAARLVATAVLLAYVQRAKTDRSLTYRRLLTLGVHVSSGKIQWDQPAE
jgi:hypothetical protein